MPLVAVEAVALGRYDGDDDDEGDKEGAGADDGTVGASNDKDLAGVATRGSHSTTLLQSSDGTTTRS